MDKPFTCHRKGLANKNILMQATTKNQEFRLIELSNYIQRRELTNALEILAQSQIEGEFAILVIRNLQDLLERDGLMSFTPCQYNPIEPDFIQGYLRMTKPAFFLCRCGFCLCDLLIVGGVVNKV